MIETIDRHRPATTRPRVQAMGALRSPGTPSRSLPAAVLWMLGLAAGLTAFPCRTIAGHSRPSGERQRQVSGADRHTIRRLVLFHTNDIHGYAFPHSLLSPGKDNRTGGLFSLATLIARARLALWTKQPAAARRFVSTGSDDGILLFDCGDSISGTRNDALSKGAFVTELLSSTYLDYDGATIGNHSGDYGLEPMIANIRARRHPVIISNAVLVDGSPIPGTVASKIIEENGLRIGVFGLCHDRSTHIDGVRMLPVFETARRMCEELRPRCDLLVLLAHLGLEREERWRRELASLDLDLILDAHSHADLDYHVGRALVVQAGHYLRRCGRVTIDFDGTCGRIVSMKADEPSLDISVTPPWKPMLEHYGRLVAEVEGMENEPVAVGLHGFFYEKQDRKSSRFDDRACKFVATAFLSTHAGGDTSKRAADVSMVYNKGVRTHVAANDDGVFTEGILHRILPFAEPLQVVELDGADLGRLVRYGLKKKFYWAGLSARVSHAFDDSGHPMPRLLALHVYDSKARRFVPLSDKRRYRLICSSFFAKVFLRNAHGGTITLDTTNRRALRRYVAEGIYKNPKYRMFFDRSLTWEDTSCPERLRNETAPW